MPADDTGRDALFFEAIGTLWQIDASEPIGQETADGIRDRIDVFDRTWSRFRDDSVVASIAASPGSTDLGEDAPALFGLYRRLGDATDGAVSPFVGDALSSIGYDREYSLVDRGGPRTAAPTWADIATLDGTVLTTSRRVTIDIGAVGKGYLVDRVSSLLRAAGHTRFTVDASGDIANRGGADPGRARASVRCDTGHRCRHPVRWFAVRFGHEPSRVGAWASPCDRWSDGITRR